MKQFSNLKRAFLPCLFVLLTLPAWGQMQPVTKNFRKTPLKNVLKEVEAQTGLSIMYDTRELNLERPVTASFDRTPVSQVLREVLDRTVQYSIKDKMIVIYKASATIIQYSIKRPSWPCR
jgi:type II secretory pathway component GspD/PulD (secretin)